MKVQVITPEKLLSSLTSPTTALTLVALADAFLACAAIILFLIANTSQPVSQQLTTHQAYSKFDKPEQRYSADYNTYTIH